MASVQLPVAHQNRPPFGFVYVDKDAPLSKVRELIREELDVDVEDLEFLHNDLPVSRKQERHLIVSQFPILYCRSKTQANDLMPPTNPDFERMSSVYSVSSFAPPLLSKDDFESLNNSNLEESRLLASQASEAPAEGVVAANQGSEPQTHNFPPLDGLSLINSPSSVYLNLEQEPEPSNSDGKVEPADEPAPMPPSATLRARSRPTGSPALRGMDPSGGTSPRLSGGEGGEKGGESRGSRPGLELAAMADEKRDANNEFVLSVTVVGTRSPLQNFSTLQNLLDYQLDPTDQVWIDVEGASVEGVMAIGKKFGLHELTIEDCHTLVSAANSREKLEMFPQYLFLLTHAMDPAYSPPQFSLAPLKMIIFSKCLLTFHSHPISAITSIWNRYKQVPSLSWVVHRVLEMTVDDFVDAVDNAVSEVDHIDDLIFVLSEHEQADLLMRIRLASRRLIELRQTLWPKRDVIMALIDRQWRKQFLTDIRIPYLRDVLDHVVVMLQKLDLAREVLDTLQNAYMAKVSIAMAESANYTNHSMQKLSSVATIILPLSFITGLFGMNVTVPGQHTDEIGVVDNLSWFFGLVSFMIVLSISMTVYFRSRRWL